MGGALESTVESFTTYLSGSQASTMTATYPSGIEADDLMIIGCGCSRNGATNWLAKTGWTLLDTTTGYGVVSAVYYKIAVGGESGTTAFTTDGNGRMSGLFWRVSGVDTSTPVNDWSLKVYTNGGANYPQDDYDLNPITTTEAGCRGAYFSVLGTNSTTVGTVVPPAGWSQVNATAGGTFTAQASGTIDSLGGAATYSGLTVNVDQTSCVDINNYFIGIAPG